MFKNKKTIFDDARGLLSLLVDVVASSSMSKNEYKLYKELERKVTCQRLITEEEILFLCKLRNKYMFPRKLYKDEEITFFDIVKSDLIDMLRIDVLNSLKELRLIFKKEDFSEEEIYALSNIAQAIKDGAFSFNNFDFILFLNLKRRFQIKTLLKSEKDLGKIISLLKESNDLNNNMEMLRNKNISILKGDA